MNYRLLLALSLISLICHGETSLHISIPEPKLERSDKPWNATFLATQIRAYWSCFHRAARRPENLQIGDLFCQAAFDGFGCWHATAAGSTESILCPSFVPGSDHSKIATKQCLGNGKWAIILDTGNEVANYSLCNFDVTEQDNPPLLWRLIKDLTTLDISPYVDPKIGHIFDDCLENVLTQPEPHYDEPHCPRTFDGWRCWNDTKPGAVAFASCPGFIPGFLDDRYAHKVCSEDGTWYRHPDTNRTWSNYTTCVDKEDLKFRERINNIYIAGYSTSVIVLTISLAIFFYFKSLQCTRITIHKNLFLSFIINNIIWIVWYTEVVQKPDVMMKNEAPCQILHIAVHYFLVSNYFWMFCEGLYLHTLLVIAFVAEDNIMKWFYVVGWGIPWIIIGVYGGVRYSFPEETQFCWIEDSVYTWIISGPVCLSMMLNFIFLVNIVRVLVTKLRAVNSPDTHQTRKAVRATLILIPLLGLHYVVTPFRPEPKSPGESVYETVSAVVTSFQGLCVALLFCFCNGEVIALVRKRWNQTLLMRGRDRRMSYAATTVSFLARSAPDVQRSRDPNRLLSPV